VRRFGGVMSNGIWKDQKKNIDFFLSRIVKTSSQYEIKFIEFNKIFQPSFEVQKRNYILFLIIMLHKDIGMISALVLIPWEIY
jgi:hypothetical protein